MDGWTGYDTGAVVAGGHMKFLKDGSGLSTYLKDIGKHRILTREEERELLERMHKGDNRAFNELITANLKFVVSVCRKFQHQGLPMSDLISEGNLGLIRAARSFEVANSCRFISYAVWWIRQRVLRALAEQSRFLNIPVGKAAAMHRMAKAERVISQRMARTPSSEELAEFLCLREKEILDLLQIGQFSLSLQDPGLASEDGVLGEALKDEGCENPEQECAEHRLKQEIRDTVAGLDDPEKQVLQLYFGLDTARSMTLEEIADTMGLPRERVRRIKESGIARLRRPIRKIRFRELF